MREFEIIYHMAQYVEGYIYQMKNVRVQIVWQLCIADQRQLNMLIDAYNYAKEVTNKQ
jgi:hypothetical protein